MVKEIQEMYQDLEDINTKLIRSIAIIDLIHSHYFLSFPANINRSNENEVKANEVMNTILAGMDEIYDNLKTAENLLAGEVL